MYADKIIDNSKVNLKLSDFNAPRIEPHYTFLLSDDVTSPVDSFTVQSKIAGMLTSVEVSDSRFGEKLAENSVSEIGDYVADNARSGIFFIGDRVNWLETFIPGVKPTICRNGEEIQVGNHSKKINALSSLVDFINVALKEGKEIKKGQWISTALNFIPVQPRAGDEIVVATPHMPKMYITIE